MCDTSCESDGSCEIRLGLLLGAVHGDDWEMGEEDWIGNEKKGNRVSRKKVECKNV